MRFKDLVEGKKYRRSDVDYEYSITYEKREGLLFNLLTNDYSNACQKGILSMEFEEVPDYVTYQEALEYMAESKTNSAEFEGKRFKFEYDILSTYKKSYWIEASFQKKYLESKWVLL